jgi:hypothetical protein
LTPPRTGLTACKRPARELQQRPIAREVKRG